jgi:hypothetical protein
MATNSKAPSLGDGAPPKQMTAHAGSSAVAVCDDTTPPPSGSNIKAVVVTLLAWLFAWRPSIAIGLGKLVLRVCPNFKRA